MLVAPVVEHRLGGAEAGAGVDHRRAADRPRRPGPGSAGCPRRSSGRRRGRGSRSRRGGPRGRSRGRSGRPPRARRRRAPPRRAPPPRPRRRRRSRRSTTSHSSPSPPGSVSPRVPAGSGSEPSARRQLISIPIRSSTSRVDRVAEGREDLRHQQQLVVEAEARALHAAQEVVAGGGVEAAEAPGEGQPLEGAQAEPDPGQDPRRDRGQELGDRAGDVDVALGGGQPVDAGRHRLADRAQGALLGGREPRRAPSAGRRAGGRRGRSATRARARAGPASRRRGS